jgi:hypothetical protein
MRHLSAWEDEGEALVLVSAVRVPDAISTICTAEGVRQSDGRTVTFAGDWRSMRTLASAIRDSGDPQLARVPAYAILTIEPRPAA